MLEMIKRMVANRSMGQQNFEPTAIGTRKLSLDKTASVAVEFALVGFLFIFLLLAIIEFGLFLFARAALDSGTQSAARTLQLGNADAFPAALCAQLPVFMSCRKLSYYVQEGNSFGAMNPTISVAANGVLNNGAAQTYPAIPFPTGTSPSAVPAFPYMTLQVSYEWNYLIGPIVNLMHLSGVVLVSTAAFEHE